MAVKIYSYKAHKNIYCSAHTQVKEMRCKDGCDTIMIDENLMEMIEKLFAKLNCKKYIISSGYRTPSHDKRVGGDGKGYHTKGKAVDAAFYDKNGKLIPAGVVCCVAQDIGFGGIANIDNQYKNVHLDVRSGKKYYGDEIRGNNTVTDNFYNYFGISRAQVEEYTGEKNTVYFNKYLSGGNSIVSALKSIGEKSDFLYRGKIAKANGINNYIGSASQNIKMLLLLKQGILIKP